MIHFCLQRNIVEYLFPSKMCKCNISCLMSNIAIPRCRDGERLNFYWSEKIFCSLPTMKFQIF